MTVGDTLLGDGVSVGQIANAHLTLYDKNIFTGYEVPSSLPGNQWVKFDWSHYSDNMYVRGVLFHTDETKMTSGTIKFYVGG